ncbi:MAG: HNH endonuclease [Ignavibacteriales bacterium]|nr:HNH endonuclease [Ignavibacteriales bacterium]
MKLIPLSRGLFAKVDDEDFDELLRYKWYAVKCFGKYYARRCDGKNKKIYMHRQIAGFPLHLNVDHRDGNSLNNQKDNLRNCNQAQNMANRKAWESSTSTFKGVCKSGEKWVARIGTNGSQIYIGTFDSEIGAALAYDKKAYELHGQFAVTNFAF